MSCKKALAPKKSFGPNCANCGTPDPPSKCGRCKTTDYCNVFCQKQHWKDGHKKWCIAVEDRKPFEVEKRLPGEVCAICLEVMTTNMKLSCEHSYHQACVVSLRKFGIQMCPVCRAGF